MKKKIVLMLACLVLLLSGCTSGSSEVTKDLAVGGMIAELPENAIEVFSHTYEGDFSETTGLFGQGVTMESWTVSGKGYFVLEIDHYSGTAENLQIRMNAPNNKTFYKFSDPQKNGLYATGSDTFSDDSNYVLYFGKADDLMADYNVYFVETE